MRIFIFIFAIALASAIPTKNKIKDKIKERPAIELCSSMNKPTNLPEDEYLTQGDIRVKKNDKRFKNRGARGLTRSAEFRWPDNTVPYDFDPIDAYDNDWARDWIKDTLLSFTQQSGNCVHFRPRTEFDSDFVRIRNTTGCSSYVGRIGGQQDMTLQHTTSGSCLNKGTIVHEFMHALGVLHETVRPDRDNYVAINYENIIPGKEDSFDKGSGNDYGSEYSYDSVMHYSAYAFSSNGLKTIEAPETIELLDPAYKPYTELLSTGDINSLRGYYQCDSPTTTTTTTTTLAPFEINIKNRMRQTITLKKVQTDGTELPKAIIRNRKTYRETTTTGVTYKIYNSNESGSITFVTGQGRFTDSGEQININSKNFRFS